MHKNSYAFGVVRKANSVPYTGVNPSTQITLFVGLALPPELKCNDWASKPRATVKPTYTE